MQSDFDRHKNDIAFALRPVFELLEYRQTTLSGLEWNRLFRQTWLSVMNSPQQYIQQEEIPDEVVHKAIYEVFNEFLERHRHFRDSSMS